jgi:hypothetical protein
MDAIYHKLLWFMGFKTGEHVSDMLARQKKRLGKWWWIFPITTMLATLCLFFFEIYLTIHVATFKLNES